MNLKEDENVFSVLNGEVKNHPDKVELKIISNIEHGALSKVNSIVVHRTAASTAQSTLNAWKTKKSGAHFLIDKNGKIYQTARLDKKCWHMGYVVSRCRLEASCTEEDTKIIKGILHGSGRWSEKFKKVLQHERKKDYPDRYPMNSDSIGIEIVGLYLGSSTSDKGLFEELTTDQASSFLWLVTKLLEYYKLSLSDDVYAHGAVARKKINEGSTALDWLKENYK
ncbi:N-acetylmuramoyl-L-alanine amidase [Marinobacterium stanieri]|uniref:peptidoglycan recognition protein family protein n=1 Tax=Marinobacterium stanieri TaxID=49186 RepID=UPI000255788D|nr:peptidoglycan recognition family protein [Marinobacterium stanieri]